MTYNLFWWNLFGQRKGNNRSAGALIEKSYREKSIDFVGFQECDNIHWILSDTNLADHFESYDAGMAVAIAWRKSTWEKIFTGKTDVSEDRKEQWYGRRVAAWGRFNNKINGQKVFFINHHGPLPVNTGGLCGGQSHAY